jgi:hypothetical protein
MGTSTRIRHLIRFDKRKHKFSPIELPNGSRYRRLGGLRERDFGGANSKLRKVPENAQTPTSRVHAVLGAFLGQWILHTPRYVAIIITGTEENTFF